MRAKNEFKFLAEAYDTKLILERVVDGKLMCPEACCGAPVMECKCGPDCPHCNCHEIQKLSKEEDAEDLSGGWESSRDRAGEMEAKEEAMRKKIERIRAKRKDKELPVGHYEHMVRLSKNHPDDNPWGQSNVQVRKTEPELIQKFLDQGYRIEKPPEDGEDDPYGILDATVRDFEQELDIQGDGIDTNVNELKDYVDIIKGLDIVEKQRESALNYLKNLRGPGGRAGLEDVDFEFVFGEEDNEEPKRGITGLNPRRSPELHSMKSHAIDKIDLNKWRKYPQDDVMKAVYRRYGRELPSVDSKDYNITWDKKIRPWLIEHEGTF